MQTITCTPDKTVKQLFNEIIKFAENTPIELELCIQYHTSKEYKIEVILLLKDTPIKLRIETENPLETKTEEKYLKEIKLNITPQEKILEVKEKRKYIPITKDYFFIDYMDNAIWLGEFYAHTLTLEDFKAKVS